jgi:hypothetical protein
MVVPGWPKKRCQVLASILCLLRSLSAMQAVLQFDDGDSREYDFCFAVLVFEHKEQVAQRLGFTLTSD